MLKTSSGECPGSLCGMLRVAPGSAKSAPEMSMDLFAATKSIPRGG